MKININRIRGRLASGKCFLNEYVVEEDNKSFTVIITISRVNLHVSEQKEKYRLTVRKFDSRYLSENTEHIIDINKEYGKLENIFIYLNKTGLLETNE